MDNLYYNMPEDKGLSGFIKGIFTKPQIDVDLSDTNNTERYLEIIKAARRELECAEKLFEYADDPDLIEYAIFQEHASRLKLSYLIKKAKENNVKSYKLTTL